MKWTILTTMSAYIPVLIFLLVAILLAIFLFVLGVLVAPSAPNKAKVAPYECGFPAMDTVRKPFDVRFYLVAILFIVFDIETALLFPWAVTFRQLSWFGVMSMLLFLTILSVVFVYEWLAGALDWE